ncbi:hypothetical protein K440DRAFT_639200 [Wilcoxina mikolae CBS 423.85]|nr:hypothetical protein K440DRAFT_639200 [Wilcoxina mikolae CBS 423.85]
MCKIWKVELEIRGTWKQNSQFLRVSSEHINKKGSYESAVTSSSPFKRMTKNKDIHHDCNKPKPNHHFSYMAAVAPWISSHCFQSITAHSSIAAIQRLFALSSFHGGFLNNCFEHIVSGTYAVADVISPARFPDNSLIRDNNVFRSWFIV